MRCLLFLFLTSLLCLASCSRINDCLQEEAVFVSGSTHETNIRVKLARIPQQVAKLRSLGITADEKSSFEVYFYTESELAARELTLELAKQGYLVGYGAIFDDEILLHSVEGSSPSIKVDEDSLAEWVLRMCEIGYEFDAKFESWNW